MLLETLRDLRSYYHGSRGRDQSEFYDLESRLPYFDQVARILGRGKIQAILEFLRSPEQEGEPLLDLGCGIGTLARELSRRGERVVGLDISARKIGRAQGLGMPAKVPRPAGRIDYIAGDFRRIGSGDGLDQALAAALASTGRNGTCRGAAAPRPALRFRRIIAADVLEHIPLEPAETIRRITDLLEPGGQLITTVPSIFFLSDPGHLWRLNPEAWEQLLLEAGFRTIRRRLSFIRFYGLWTPLPMAMVLDLRKGDLQ